MSCVLSCYILRLWIWLRLSWCTRTRKTQSDGESDECVNAPCFRLRWLAERLERGSACLSFGIRQSSHRLDGWLRCARWYGRLFSFGLCTLVYCILDHCFSMSKSIRNLAQESGSQSSELMVQWRCNRVQSGLDFLVLQRVIDPKMRCRLQSILGIVLRFLHLC